MAEKKDDAEGAARLYPLASTMTDAELAELYKKSAHATPAGNDDEVRRGALEAARARGLTEEAATAEGEHAVDLAHIYAKSAEPKR